LKAGGNLLRSANFSQIFFTVEKRARKIPPATQNVIEAAFLCRTASNRR
jgi:hypothetical protein